MTHFESSLGSGDEDDDDKKRRHNDLEKNPNCVRIEAVVAVKWEK